MLLNGWQGLGVEGEKVLTKIGLQIGMSIIELKLYIYKTLKIN